jgi:predicted nuclease of predicted toxin-antitoxin system
MKFLADENFPASAIKELRRRGLEVFSIAEELPGTGDEAIIVMCAAEKFTLLTLDKDFGELVFRRDSSAGCGVILFRVEVKSPDEFGRLVVSALDTLKNLSNYFAVVEHGRIRIRSTTNT